jgi:hypothetical protein
MQLVSVTTLPYIKKYLTNPLNNNSSENITLDLQLPIAIEYTQPYWLKEKEPSGCTLFNQENIGIPDILRE